MQKPLMIVIAAGFLIAVIFMYFSRPGRCATIKEQTTQKLSVSVDVIKANGALVIGGEKVQEVSDGAQKVGEHLMACCDAQHGDHPLPPDQYLACINGAKDYEAKIIQITNIIQEADTAKQQGNTQVAEQKIAEAKAAVDASTNIERDLGKLAEAAQTARKQSEAAQIFFDNFAESELKREWELKNPDPQKWTMQPTQKSLLIETQTGSLSDSKNLKNWLVLNKDLPDGDFEVVVEASIEIQDVGNSVGVALFQDDQNYLWVGFSGDAWGSNINRRSHLGKVFQGKVTSIDGERKGFGIAQQHEHIFFKIERIGNEYSGYSAYLETTSSADQIAWTKIGTLPWVNFNGKIVLFAYNFTDSAPGVAAEFYSMLIRNK